MVLMFKVKKNRFKKLREGKVVQWELLMLKEEGMCKQKKGLSLKSKKIRKESRG